jgi:addiction module RelB/DinJ family antitoxin
MSTIVKKRIQYTVDKGILESAEFIMSKFGLNPATMMSMVYAEIARTGKLPVTTQISNDDFNKAKILEASYNLPTVNVNTPQEIDSFLNDDGGY